MASVTAIGSRRGAAAPTVAAAVDRYLASAAVAGSANTRRAYTSALEKIVAEIGADRALAEVAGQQIADALEQLWGGSAESTWNRNRAVATSWLSWCADSGWACPELPRSARRRREKRTETRAVEWAVIDRLCSRRDVPLRDKTLFRLLYESSSRASAVLALNIEDLDLRNRTATITQKGGHQLQIAWGDGAAAILGRLVAGRVSGPVFLTDLPAGPQRAAATRSADIDEDTGRTRLSYGRARALIEKYTDGGITLHQLRHSSLTHLAEAGVGTTTLMAKSGHTNLRSLQRYARPSFAAVQDATDLLSSPPNRRKRT